MSISLDSNLHFLTNNQAVVEVSGSTVAECLNQLVRKFPKLKPMLFDKRGRLLNYVGVFVNQEDSYPEELAKPVKDGDELYIALMIVGG